jgi:hypothetical protein
MGMNPIIPTTAYTNESNPANDLGTRTTRYHRMFCLFELQVNTPFGINHANTVKRV